MTIPVPFNDRYEPCPMTGCWLWTGGLFQTFGYGQYWFEGCPQYAHRVSWRLHVGFIPEGLFVLHHCDTPCCVAPHHLYLGTQADNMRDRAARGKTARGENKPNAKLTDQEIRLIRMSPLSTNELARRYGKHPKYIADIRHYRRWKHVT